MSNPMFCLLSCISEKYYSIAACFHAPCLTVPSGLDKIYELTNTPTQYELRFDLGLGSEKAYAVYDNFKIGPAKQKFRLTIGAYSGTAGGPSAPNIFSKLSAEQKPDTEKTT